MRNREKLSKMAQIDLLYSMAENRLRSPVKGPCILYLLDQKPRIIGLICPSDNKDIKAQCDECYKCIAEYLNEEVK